MKPRMKEIIDAVRRYNSADMAYQAFGLSAEEEYDALVVAPSYTPMKIMERMDCKITILREGAYLGGYLVEKDGLRLAWIKTSASASNLIDHLAICAELKFRKIIFIGAVGALTGKFALGDICTPVSSVLGGYAQAYLREKLTDFTPFETVTPDLSYTRAMVDGLAARGLKLHPATVFCTDSIACEYAHLNEIRAFGTDLIEMETGALTLMADLLEIPTLALLVVSDNSATGIALIGRTEEEQERYDRARKEILPKMILNIAQMEAVARNPYKNICATVPFAQESER